MRKETHYGFVFHIKTKPSKNPLNYLRENYGEFSDTPGKSLYTLYRRKWNSVVNNRQVIIAIPPISHAQPKFFISPEDPLILDSMIKLCGSWKKAVWLNTISNYQTVSDYMQLKFTFMDLTVSLPEYNKTLPFKHIASDAIEDEIESATEFLARKVREQQKSLKKAYLAC